MGTTNTQPTGVAAVGGSDEHLTQPRNRDTAIRNSVRALPGQRFFDWLSGCPQDGSTPPKWRTPATHTLDAVGGFFLAWAAAAASVLSGSVVVAACILPPALLVMTGRARKMFITIEHQVVHSQLFRIKSRPLRVWLNRLVGELVGVSLWLPEPSHYKETHAESHHNFDELATPKDKDGISFFRLGFRPGLPVADYWRLLWRTLTSPHFYLRETGKRVRLSLFESSRLRLVLSWLWLAALLVPAPWVGGWWAALAVYGTAVFVGFPAAGLLQTAGRHHWGCHLDKLGTRERTARVCQGRFLLDPYPSPGAGVRARAVFWLRLVFYHLPVRLAVLNGDVQHHDWHHRVPGSKDWAASGHARARDAAAGTPGWQGLPYTHTWTLFEAIGRTFAAMSAAPPLTEEWEAVVREAADSEPI